MTFCLPNQNNKKEKPYAHSGFPIIYSKLHSGSKSSWLIPAQMITLLGIFPLQPPLICYVWSCKIVYNQKNREHNCATLFESAFAEALFLFRM